jgi:hypothetical protein
VTYIAVDNGSDLFINIIAHAIIAQMALIECAAGVGA